METCKLQLIKLEEQLESRATMSSKEISELTGKLHKNVIRDVVNILCELYDIKKDGSDLSYQLKQYVSVDYDKRGYISMIYLDKELTLIVTSGYSVKQRQKIVRKALELDNYQARLKFAYDDIERLKNNGSIWGQAGAIQKKQKRAAQFRLNKVLSEVQQRLF